MSAQPNTFTDRLDIRSEQTARGTIGNPYAHLNAIGVTAILEYLYKGANLVDVAETINVSVTVLRSWLDNEGHWPRIEEATILSADGYLALGRRLLTAANTKLDMDKAKAILEHARWLAGKINKPVYGTTEVAAAGTTVSFVLNIGGQHATLVAAAQAPQVLEDAADMYWPPIVMALPGAAEPETGPFNEMPDPRELEFAQEWLQGES